MLTAEDVILSKLLWIQAGGGERHEGDIRAIVRVRGGSLDVAYMRRWADELGVFEQMEAALTGQS